MRFWSSGLGAQGLLLFGVSQQHSLYEGRRLCLKARIDTEFVRGGLHSFHNDGNGILQVRANEMVVPERGEKR